MLFLGRWAVFTAGSAGSTGPCRRGRLQSVKIVRGEAPENLHKAGLARLQRLTDPGPLVSLFGEVESRFKECHWTLLVSARSLRD